MHAIQRSLLFTAVLGIFSAASLLAQHGGAGGRTLQPSSTALGAGALSAFPSSTSRSSAPSMARYGRGAGNYRGSYGAYGRAYRPLPRSYVIAPYYYPFFDWSGASDYSAAPAPDDSGYGYGPDPATEQMMMNQAALGQQVQQLTAQVNSMMYGPGPYTQQQAGTEQQPPPPPVTLVLKSGEKLQVENYAITGNTFWDFTQRGTRKIPLSTIDLAASAKATQANGGDFPQIEGAQ